MRITSGISDSALRGEPALTYNKNIQSNLKYMNNQNISDQNLYCLCKTYGARALEWRRKFIGLLPEVNRRRLYEKKGFGSIFVFAYKLAGLSEGQVRLALNLERRFEGMPNLQRLLVNGEVSANKLARVASIANTKNDEFLAERVKILSQSAVETLVRDENFVGEQEGVSKNKNGLFEAKNDDESVRAHTFLSPNQPLNLSTEVHQKLLELQERGLDVNQILLDFLQKREEEIAERKERIREKVLQKEEEKRKRMTEFEEISDYVFEKPDFLKARPRIPVATRKILHEEYGTKCSVKSCQKRAENIHHTLPFSIGKTNDPKFLVPLCKEHHEIAHACDMRYQEIKSLSRH